MTGVDTERCVDLVRELVTIASPTGGEEAAASFLAERLRQVEGVEVEEIDDANVVATVSGRLAGPRRLFLTHLDTVTPRRDAAVGASVADGASFGKQGKVLRGVGTAAPKGAVAAMVTALSAVAADPDSLTGSVQLVAVSKDLASDHAGLKEVIAHRPLEADWAVAGEPSGNAVVIGARGIMHLQVEFLGITAHCGMPTAAVNPLYGLADFLHAVRAAELPRDGELGDATLAPFKATAAGTPPLTPERASVMVDRRILPHEDTDTIIADFTTVADESARATEGLKSEVTVLKTMFPFSVPADDPFTEVVTATLAEAFGRDPDVTAITFSSNAGYMTRVLGTPSLAFGPGEIADIGDDEHVSINQLADAVRGYAALMASDVSADARRS